MAAHFPPTTQTSLLALAGDATDKGLLHVQEDLSHTYCSAEDCRVGAGFGYPGRKPERCKAHVLDGMVRITLTQN